MPSLPFGYVLFADDIRAEVGNKASVMGIYEQDVLFPPGTQFPTVLAKLGVLIFWREPREGFAKKLQFKITLSPLDGSDDATDEVVLLDLVIDAAAEAEKLPKLDNPFSSLAVKPSFVLSPLVISAPSKLRVTVMRDDDGEAWALGRLNFPAPEQLPELTA